MSKKYLITIKINPVIIDEPMKLSPKGVMKEVPAKSNGLILKKSNKNAGGNLNKYIAEKPQKISNPLITISFFIY